MHKMRPRFLCSSLPVGLMFGFFLFLLRPVSTQKNRNRMYFSDNGDNIVLNGPDNPEKYTVVVWEWKPHSRKEIKKLTTFRRTRGRWSKEKAAGESKVDLYREMNVNRYTLDLTINKPTFKWAGFFTLAQTIPRKQILKQYEIFVIKAEASPQRPLLGSDVTLSCTISRLSDTVSLHWRPMDSPQQNTDQICLNNTVYLMVRHVTVEDGKYVCEVQENGNNVHTSNGDFTVEKYLYKKRYTLYRSSKDHSELHLVCYFYYRYSTAEWTWTSRRLQQQQTVIASAGLSQPINVNRTYFRNRLMTSVKHFDGNDFNMRIVPILFLDAGLYTCSMEKHQFPTIDLITVKVTAEPSDAMTEGDNVILTCSVSRVTESMRLIWINGDGKTVGEKSLIMKDISLSLVIQKAERDRGNWRCGYNVQLSKDSSLFQQDVEILFTFSIRKATLY